MSIDAAVVWEIRTDGAQTNGGGFKTGASGVDYSQQAAAQWALNPVTSAAITATMVNANAHADMVGNICRVVSGTNATLGWYEIISVNTGVDITVDRNWCSGVCVDGVVNIGGAFAFGGSLDNDFFASGAKVAGHQVWVRGGTHTLGEITQPSVNGSSTATSQLLGYNATRGDNPIEDDRPLIDCGGFRFGFDLGPNYWWNIKNLRFISAQNGYTFSAASFGYCVNVKVENTSTGSAFSTGQGTQVVGCEAIANYSTASGFYGNNYTSFVGCYACGSFYGFLLSGQGSLAISCVVDTCHDGFYVGSGGGKVINCTATGCETGINIFGNYLAIVNNILYSNYNGIKSGSAFTNSYFDYNCYYNNGTDVINVTKGENAVDGNPLLSGISVIEGADGVTDGVSGKTFTAASNPFVGVTTDDYLNIVEAGTGATPGPFRISVVVGDGELTLDSSAGVSKTGISYKIVKGADFVPSAGSAVENAGFDAGGYTEVVV